MLSKGEKFEHAAGIELLLPSNSSDLINEGHIVDGQTEIGVVWGSAAQLTEHTALDVELRYTKGVQNKLSSPTTETTTTAAAATKGTVTGMGTATAGVTGAARIAGRQ